MKEEADRCGGSGEDLRKFQPLGDERLVVAVGELTPETRQDEERADEDGTGQRHQDARMGGLSPRRPRP